MNELTDDVLNDLVNQEIARELMLEVNSNFTEEQFQSIWKLCKGNPWNAGVLYQILEMNNE